MIGAAIRAIDVTAVAVTTDNDLAVATCAVKHPGGWILTRLGETMDWLCESTVWGVASAFDRQILAGVTPVSSATPSIPVFRPDVI